MFNPMENPDFAARMTRVQKAIHLEEPDRVPLVPTLGNICSNAYGVPLQDAMMDQRKIIPALEQRRLATQRRTICICWICFQRKEWIFFSQ